MYMHERNLMHVHASSPSGEIAETCRRSPLGLRLWSAPTNADCDVAGALVHHALGPAAKSYFRNSQRRFPLVYGGTWFSVSHSPVTTVLAAAEVAIGVDIEHRLGWQARSDLAWALSEGERRELDCAKDDRVLTEIWTAKEAAGKALGVGLQAMPAIFDSRPTLATPSHRTVEIPAALGAVACMDSHGVWWGDSHLRVAWMQERYGLG